MSLCLQYKQPGSEPPRESHSTAGLLSGLLLAPPCVAQKDLSSEPTLPFPGAEVNSATLTWFTPRCYLHTSNSCRQCTEGCVSSEEPFSKEGRSEAAQTPENVEEEATGRGRAPPSGTREVEMTPTRTKPRWHLTPGPRTHLRMCPFP